MKTIEEIIERALQLKPGSVEETDDRNTIDGWDSLGHLRILTELDTEFEGKLAEVDELSQVKSVKGIKEVLRSRGLLAK